MMKWNYDFVYNVWDSKKWIADNAMLLEDWAIVDCKNMDIRTALPEVIPAIAPVEAFGVEWKEIYCWTWEYFFWEDWVWYNSAWTKILNSWNDYVWCSKYNWRYYLFEENWSNPKIWSIPVEDTIWSTNWNSEWTWNSNWTPTNRDTYRKAHWNYWVSTIIFQWNLYFTNDDNIMLLDENNTVFVWLECPDTVVAITVYGSRLKVYCENWLILFRSWIEWTSWEESIDLWEPIKLVVWQAGRDYIFAWDNSSWLRYIYEMTWYNIAQIKNWHKSYISVRPWWETSQHQWVMSDWILYFPWGLSAEWVYTFGNAFPWMPQSFAYEYWTASTWFDYADIYSIREYWNNIYISYTDVDWTTWMDVITKTWNRYDNWEIVFEALWDRMTVQSVLWLEARASGRIVIEYQYNQDTPIDYSRKESQNASWIERVDSDDREFEDNLLRIHWIEADLPDFRDIQFRITCYESLLWLNIYWHNVRE